MRRSLVTLVAVTALAAWAGAQGPPLPADQQVKLFRANQNLIDNLIDHGVKLAEASDPLDRATECRRTARSLANALERAARDEQDPDRVAELAGLVGEVVGDGLAPTLDEAKRSIPATSPRAGDLAKLRQQAAADLDGIQTAVPPGGKVGDSQRVRAALAALAGLKDRLAK